MIFQPGKQSSEFLVIMSCIIISACWILGLDIQPFIRLLVTKEAADIMGSIATAHPRGDWQALAAMWGGASVYTIGRVYFKVKFPQTEQK